MKRNTLSFHLPVSFFKEGKHYVAHTYALDLSTSGKSLKQVKARFTEATHLFFEELAASGNTTHVLLDLGWKKKGKNWLPPVQVAHELETFSISA